MAERPLSEQVYAQDGKYVTVFELSKYAIIYQLGVLAIDHCVSYLKSGTIYVTLQTSLNI